MSEYNELLDNSDSDQYDDDFEKAAIDELEKEFNDGHNTQEGRLKDPADMDIIDKLINVGKENLKKEAKNLIGK